jgi:hypothetical protein
MIYKNNYIKQLVNIFQHDGTRLPGWHCFWADPNTQVLPGASLQAPGFVYTAARTPNAAAPLLIMPLLPSVPLNPQEP